MCAVLIGVSNVALLPGNRNKWLPLQLDNQTPNHHREGAPGPSHYGHPSWNGRGGGTARGGRFHRNTRRPRHVSASTPPTASEAPSSGLQPSSVPGTPSEKFGREYPSESLICLWCFNELCSVSATTSPCFT